MITKIEKLFLRLQNSSYLEDKLVSLEELNLIADEHPDLVSIKLNDYILTNFSISTNVMEISILIKGFSSSIKKQLAELFFKDKNNFERITETIYNCIIKKEKEKIYLLIVLLKILFVLSLVIPPSLDILETEDSDKIIEFYVESYFNDQLPVQFNYKYINQYLKLIKESKNINDILLYLSENNHLYFLGVFLIKDPGLCISLSFLNIFDILIDKNTKESLVVLKLILIDNEMAQRMFNEYKINEKLKFELRNVIKFTENFDQLILLKEYKNIYENLNNENLDFLYEKFGQLDLENEYFALIFYKIIQKNSDKSIIIKIQEDVLLFSLLCTVNQTYLEDFLIYSKESIKSLLDLPVKTQIKYLFGVLIFKLINVNIDGPYLALFKDFSSSVLVKALCFLNVEEKVNCNSNKKIFYLKKVLEGCGSVKYLPDEVYVEIIAFLNMKMQGIIYCDT